MIKIVELGDGKFGLKNVDDLGNSLNMREETFESHEEASAFVVSLGENEEVLPEAPLKGEENHESNDTPSPEDKDHYIEVSSVKHVDGSTEFTIVNYYLNADGTKTVKTMENLGFLGELTTEEVLEKVKNEIVEPGWQEKVVFAEETTTL